MIRRIAGAVKLRREYGCSVCGRKELGSTENVEFDCRSVGDACAFLLNIAPSAHNMPVGWASFYAPVRDEYRCVDCKEKK